MTSPDPYALTKANETLYVTASGWMIRRPRGADEGWLLDLSGICTNDDYDLLNRRHKEELRVVFGTPEAAIDCLRPLLENQVRCGQHWREDLTGKEVEITQINHYGAGPDGTVFVRELTDPNTSWSPGDFRKSFTRIK